MSRRTLSLLLTLWLCALGAAAPALAEEKSCNDAMLEFKQRRDNAMAGINQLVSAAHGKQLDPTVFCAKSAPLNAAESAWIAYMEKNKDWCGVPDDMISGLKSVHAKNVGFGAKACTAAAQLKKMKEQAAQGGGNGASVAQPLPAGPL